MRNWSRTAVSAISICALILVLLGGYGIYRLMGTIPSLPGEPRAPVLAVPVLDAAPRFEPYQGPHPRLMARPVDHVQYPIRLGETGPVEGLFSGELQYPFFCGNDSSRDRAGEPAEQVLPDNDQGFGVPVFAIIEDEAGRRKDFSTPVAYSKDCSRPTHARYFYLRQGTDRFFPLEEADGDIEQITVNGELLDYVVRLETGTINRFVYAIAVLRGAEETLDQPLGTYWNNRLIYHFRGGVGIGRQQGDFSPSHVLRERDRQLRQGYAVVYATANQTRNHFNIWLAEDTALRVKRQFISLYGAPLYTVGVGGSGGAVQQYLLAQNNPQLLDAAIALYSYPDMVTQTTHIQDCELLEHYFDVTDRRNGRWRKWEERSLIYGHHADSAAPNRYAPIKFTANLLRGRWSQLPSMKGSSACVTGWRGLTPLIANPNFVDNEPDYAPDVVAGTNWTYWDDLQQFFGLDEQGHANNTWDNTGVQYGLNSLRRGDISMETFLHLNANTGGWKPQHEWQQEKFWFLNGGLWPIELTLHSEQNQYRPGPNGEPAARSSASLPAIAAAYQSGQVFTGVADIPIIDMRHYLEPELDMHYARATFVARSRMLRAQGHADNQLIWMSRPPHDPQLKAFEVIDQWLANIRRNPDAGVAANRPLSAQHRCYRSDGELIASGAAVWDGPWQASAVSGSHPLDPDDKLENMGECLREYPLFSTSREMAGAGITADIFKCQLQGIDQAIRAGVYAPVDVSPWYEQLKTIFPHGVCDYSMPDQGLPPELLPSLLRAGAESHSQYINTSDQYQ